MCMRNLTERFRSARPNASLDGSKMQGQARHSHDNNNSRKEKLRDALVRKLMAKYHPGLANSRTEALVNGEVDRLMQLRKVTEHDLLEVESKVRKQSNEEIGMISTNPFKRVTSFKSGAKDEWAIMNDLMVKAGLEASFLWHAISRRGLPLII